MGVKILFVISIIIISVGMFTCGYRIGHYAGMMRAATSAILVEYNEDSYQIQYDLIGTHLYY